MVKNFNEKFLVDKLDKILRKEFGTNLAFREFSAGYGIADLVFTPHFSFDKKKINRIPLTDFDSLRLLFSFKTEKHYSLSEISKKFPYLTNIQMKKHLNLLIRNNYIVKNKDFYYKDVSNNLFNPIKKVIAIEVKLTDHRNGLIQAKRYQYFADESYLAILKESEKNIDFDEFNKNNIGLILFDSTKNSIEIKRPEKTNSFNNFMTSLLAKELILNKFINVSF